MDNIVASIICSEFQKQFKDARRSNERMVVEFYKNVDHDKEDGYRYLELRIHAPSNYVRVECRERWNVIPVEGLEWDERRQAGFVTLGFAYEEGESEWKELSHHDSAWRDAVRRFVHDHRHEVSGIQSLFGSEGWYTVEKVSE